MGLGRCWGWCEGRRFCGADRAGKPARDNGPPAASAGAAQTESLAPPPLPCSRPVLTRRFPVDPDPRRGATRLPPGAGAGTRREG
jgi:hypothetical protein